MRTFIYKRTHKGDPDKRGRFGINDCMGRDRSFDFNAVIGVGGIGIQAKAAFESASDVIFAATLPCAEVACRGNAFITGIEAQHDFAQTYQVPHAFAFGFDIQFCHDS